MNESVEPAAQVDDPSPTDRSSPQPDAPEADKGGALRKLVIRGSAAEMIGYGSGQVIRLGSQLVLSRLLFPEAYGLSALVLILTQGLIMLSDVGLPTVVVQSARGDDIKFLNTAFTWQAARAGLLYVAACALAWPMAIFMREPELTKLIPFGALSLLFMGVRSTSYYTLRRQLRIVPLMFLEIGAQVSSIAVMVPWALIKPSAWTLIGGMATASAAQTIGTHFIRVGYRNKFEWDKESAKDMFAFGKWIAGSSMLTYASQQGDRFLIGRFLGAATLGVYSMAVLISSAVGEAISRVTGGVFLGAYSRVQNTEPHRLGEVFYRTRLVTDAIVLPALGGLGILGPWVVNILFDPRYEAAGWMLRVLSVRVAISCMVAPMQQCLFASGFAQYGFYLNLARVLTLLVGVPIGYGTAGVSGLVWAVTISEVPALLVCYYGLARAKVLSILHELRAPGFYFIGLVLGVLAFLALEALGWSKPGKISFHH